MADNNKEELVQRAKMAEQAERYDDMAKAMKKVGREANAARCCSTFRF